MVSILYRSGTELRLWSCRDNRVWIDRTPCNGLPVIALLDRKIVHWEAVVRGSPEPQTFRRKFPKTPKKVPNGEYTDHGHIPHTHQPLPYYLYMQTLETRRYW